MNPHTHSHGAPSTLPETGANVRRRASRLTVAALVSAALLAGAAACSADRGGVTSSSSSGHAGASSAQSGGAKAAAPGVAPAAGADSASLADGTADGTASSGTVPAAPSALLQQRRLILNTALAVTVGNVQQAADRVRSAAVAAGGYVGDEQTSGTGHTARSALTLRVPSARLATVTDQVAALGTVRSRSQTSDDVTQQSVDVASRLATQKASVARVRALLARATRISDIVLIEGELSRRESNLESLEAQLKSLNDQVDLATLSVTLTAPGAPAPKPVTANTGFFAGLDHGWSAFTGSLVVALTVLGALLPFAVLLALVGGPAWLIWRRRRANLPPAAVPET